MNIKNKSLFIIIGIVLLGAFFRFSNINWDNNSHLHPDERFLTMVGTAMTVPNNFGEYLNSNVSTFNPRNIGFDFYVYGTFPLTLNKITAIVFNADNYNLFTTSGRTLSAIFDTLVIILIYKTVEIFEKRNGINKRIKFYASFFYAIFVLPIQLSHFFAVDTFLNFFVFASVFFSLKYYDTKKVVYILAAAIVFGLGLSSKVTAAAILPLIIFWIASIHTKKDLVRAATNIFIFGVVSFLTVKIADPTLFMTGIFNFIPSKSFLENLTALRSMSDKNSLFPPNVQWINKTPIIFPLANVALFGIGLPSFLLFLVGVYTSLKSKAKYILAGILLWILVFFLYQGMQVSMTMRYFIMLYPFIAVFAGFGLSAITDKRASAVAILLILVWPLFFFSIYRHPTTRVAATEWINKNIPAKSIILTEYWDDALPTINGNEYQILQVPVFDPDTPAKWTTINPMLAKGNYLILSSNRGWGSITTVPEKYPQMSKFYKDLFAGKLNYKKIKEFTSYPSLEYLGIPITLNDDYSEEAFTVYDHPKVMIFKKN